MPKEQKSQESLLADISEKLELLVNLVALLVAGNPFPAPVPCSREL